MGHSVSLPLRISKMGRHAIQSAIAVLAVAVFMAATAGQALAAPVKADPNDGFNKKLTIVQDDTANKWDYDGSNITTRLRWVNDENGNYVYCINPGVLNGPFQSTKKDLPARLLKASDFKSTALYEATLAALYYAPGGPGYKNEGSTNIGKNMFPDADYKGGSFGFKDRFGTAHCLMGFYYNEADWSKTYPMQLWKPADSYKTWFYKFMVPEKWGGTKGSFGEQAIEAFNDETMLANGGYTVKQWKKSVYLVIPGDDDDTKQDMLTYVDVPHSYINMSKVSAASSVTSGNSLYSLADAVYTIYSDKALTKVVGTIITDSKGAGKLSDPVALGTYYAKETKASKGYMLDNTVYEIDVDDPDDGGSFTAKEPPRYDPISIALGKVDASTMKNTPQGTASLAGAEFTVRYYDDYYGSASALPASATKTWKVTTDANGRGNMSVNLSLGTYTVQETKAPKGYQIDSKLYIGQIIEDNSRDNGANMKAINYDSAGNTVLTYNNPDGTPIVSDPVKTFGVKVGKIDALFDGAQPEGDATLEGAVFSIVNNSPNPVKVAGKEYAKGQEVATMTSKKDGNSYVAQCDGKTLPFGDYIIKEKTPPTGYLLNSEWSVTVSADDAWANGTVRDLTAQPVADTPIRGGIDVPKVDRELDEALPLGAATLAGAEMTIYLDSAQPVKVDGNTFQKGDAVKVIVTGEDGKAATGDHDLPYGTYTVKETKAPTGYLLNKDWSATIQVREDGEVYTADAVDDQVKRGDLRFNKISDSMSRMGQVAFLVTSKTTGESHVLVGDENGNYDTSSAWNPHTQSTNANDAALIADVNANEGDDSGNGDDGEGESGDEPTDEGSDEQQGASEDGEPEGTQDAEDETKLSTQADDEAGLSVDDVLAALADAIGADDVTIDDAEAVIAGILAGTPFEDVSITANYGGEAHGLIATLQEDGSISIRDAETDDEVAYIEAPTDPAADDPQTGEDPDPNDDPANGEDPADNGDDNGNGDNGETGEPAAVEHQIDMSLIDDEAGIWFNGRTDRTTEPNDSLGALPYDTYVFQELSSEANDGYDLVSFEVTIKRDGYDIDQGTVTDDAHDIEISTELTDEDGNHVVSSAETIGLVDHVSYKNLEKGKTYVMKGTLIDKETGKQVGEVSSEEFEAEKATGTVDVSFELDPADVAGKVLVAFEELEDGGKKVAEHKDIDDVAQTVTIPGIGTTLADAKGAKVALAEGTVTLEDRVDYANLEPGVAYTLYGTLHVKGADGADGGVFADADGQEVASDPVEFTPEAANGSVTVPFTFNAEGLPITEIVAFEQLEADGKVMAKHEDIDDEGQTFTVEPGPALEKYINKDVHQDLKSLEETFTYDIMAYVTADATSTTITDELVKNLEFVSSEEEVTVHDMGTENNHKVNGTYSEASQDATVTAEGEDITASAKVEIEGKKLTVKVDDIEAAGLRGHWLRVTFDAKSTAADGYEQIDVNDPVLSDKGHLGIPNQAKYKINTAQKPDAYSLKSNIVTVKPPATPAIEKYVNKDVHQDLASLEETFTYDIMSYVTPDAVSVTINDELVKNLDFVAGLEEVYVADMGTENNHKVNGTYSTASKGASVSDPGTAITDKAKVTIDGRKLTVKIDDIENLGLRGHWVKVAFDAKANARDGYEKVEDNDPVLSDKDHEGIPNKASYKIDIADKPDAYSLESNTVTVRPPAVSIATVATDAEDGDHEVAAGDAKIQDTVTYKGLTPGHKYRLVARLVDKSSEHYLKLSDGIVYAEKSFTAQAANGDEVVAFPTLNLVNLEGKKLVAYEELYDAEKAPKDGEKPIAVHKDINDDAQTITVGKKSPETPKAPPADTDTPSPVPTQGTPGESYDATGNLLASWWWLPAVMAALAALGYLGWRRWRWGY